MKKKISILIPVLNEEANLQRVRQELNELRLRLASYDFEFLFLNNGSNDRSLEIIRKFCSDDSVFKCVSYSRTFDLEHSLTYGYQIATGDAMVVLYSDLQDPPNVIDRFVAKWEEGFDVVFGYRLVRHGDPWWRNLLVKWAYKFISWCANIDIPRNAGDFRLVTRDVRDALIQCPEYNRYMRGLISWLGFKQIGIEYERVAREGGRSKAPFSFLVLFGVRAVTSFSMRPLRLFFITGICILGFCFLAALFYLGGYLYGITPKGITTVIGLLLAGIGLNSLAIGVLGEYIGMIYMESKRRPLVIVKEKLNLNDK